MPTVKQKTKKEIVYAEPKKQHHIKGLLIANIVLSALLLLGGFATFLVIYYIIAIGASIIGGFIGLVLAFLLCLPVGALLIAWLTITITATTKANALRKESVANFRIIYIILTALVLITTVVSFAIVFLPSNDLTSMLSEIIVAVHAVSLILSIIFSSIYLSRRK